MSIVVKLLLAAFTASELGVSVLHIEATTEFHMYAYDRTVYLYLTSMLIYESTTGGKTKISVRCERVDGRTMFLKELRIDNKCTAKTRQRRALWPILQQSSLAHFIVQRASRPCVWLPLQHETNVLWTTRHARIPGIPAPEPPKPALVLADSHRTVDFAIPSCAD